MSKDRAQYLATIRDLRAAAHAAGVAGRLKRIAAKADEDRARLLRSQARALQDQFDRVLAIQEGMR